MVMTEEYIELMYYSDLVDRFRAGDFGLFEEELAILREYVDNFYDSVKSNGCVVLEEFVDFMDFLCIIKDADSNAVQNILTTAFMKSAELRNSLPNYVDPYDRLPLCADSHADDNPESAPR